MAVRKSLATMLLVLALGACAELTAERPLFSVADQGELPALREGIWIGVGEGCPSYMAHRRRFPSDCVPLDIRQQDDGAWRVEIRVDLVEGMSAAERAEAEDDAQNGPYRVIIAPAVERTLGNSFAPLYLAELDLLRDDLSAVSYAVIAPRGEMPASEMWMAATIGCDTIVRDGPIEGVTLRYVTRTDEQGTQREELDGCTASSQAAVREAARRVVIERLGELTQRRFVFVRAD